MQISRFQFVVNCFFRVIKVTENGNMKHICTGYVRMGMCTSHGEYILSHLIRNIERNECIRVIRSILFMLYLSTTVVYLIMEKGYVWYYSHTFRREVHTWEECSSLSSYSILSWFKRALLWKLFFAHYHPRMKSWSKISQPNSNWTSLTPVRSYCLRILFNSSPFSSIVVEQ